MASSTIPEWQLSPKHNVFPSVVVEHESDQQGRFVLALALVFNDLKGMVLYDHYLMSIGAPKNDDWGEMSGQWRGIRTQINRWIAGILHELLNTINKAKNVVRAKSIVELVKSLPDKAQQGWKELTDAAFDTSSNTTTMLHRIRNNTAFHYGPKDLAEGYLKQFVQDRTNAPDVPNLTAQYSYGPDMDGTRFYFADAAVQQKMLMLGEQFGLKADNTVSQYASKVNETLAPLIDAFIRKRLELADAAAQPDRNT